MKLRLWGSLALLMAFAVVATSSLPAASAGQGSVTLGSGETFSEEVKMAQGHTMYAKFESTSPLVFMIVDPNGNIVHYTNSTYEGFFLDAEVGGDYILVWQSNDVASTSLSYDYNDDVIGLNSPAVQLLILVGAAIIAAALIVIMVRRRKRRRG